MERLSDQIVMAGYSFISYHLFFSFNSRQVLFYDEASAQNFEMICIYQTF